MAIFDQLLFCPPFSMAAINKYHKRAKLKLKLKQPNRNDFQNVVNDIIFVFEVWRLSV